RPGQVLQDQLHDHGVRVRLAEGGPGLAGQPDAVEQVGQRRYRSAGRLTGVVDRRESRTVAEQVPEGDRGRARYPPGDQVPVDVGVQVQPALPGQPQNRERGQVFADRTDLEHGVRRHGRPTGNEHAVAAHLHQV